MAKVKCQSKANPTRLKPPIKRIMQSNLHVQRIGTATVSLLTRQPRKAEQIIFLPFLRFAFRLHRTGSRPVGVVTFQRGLDETRRGSCSQEEVSAPTSRKKKKFKKTKQKTSVAQEWSHAMPGRACTPVCRQGWTCTARCLLLPLKGEVQTWIICRFHFKTNAIFSKHDCVFFRSRRSCLCLVRLFHGLTGNWCRQPTWLLWYRPDFRNDACLFFNIAV